jgi:putative salt-induced outer membrane protein YdiY
MDRRVTLLLVLLAIPVRADVIVFKNGDQVQGTIVSMVDGVLSIDSSIAGRIQVPMSLVTTFRTEAPAQVVLDDGTTVQQKIEQAEAGSVAVAPGGTLVPQELEVEKIRKINPPPEGLWKGQAKGSLDINAGNTEKAEYDAELAVSRETSKNLIRAWATYEADNSGKGSERITTKRETHYGARYQHVLTPRNFWYTQSVVDREAQSNLDLRLRLSGGVGRRLIDTEKWQLTLEGGPAWVSENFSDGITEDNSYLAGRIAWDALRRINPRFELFHTAYWYPSLESGKDHLVEFTGGARTRLTQRLSLEGKVIWDYDTTPAEERERQDTEYLLSLLVDF